MNTRARVAVIPALIAGALASLPGAIKVAAAPRAHGAAIPAAWTDPDLPQLSVNVTGDAVEGVPDVIDAGRYLLTVRGESLAAGPPPGVMILQLPEGLTLDEASAQAQSSNDGPPPFYYESLLAGGASVDASGAGISAIDLPPGEWIAAGTYFSRPPVPFVVTGELPTELPEPKSTATFTLREMTIEIIEGAPVAGENRLKIENLGGQPHFIEIIRVPDGTTSEDAERWLHADMSGTPVANFDIELVTSTPDQSGGVTQWVSVTLERGTYQALCFVPDPESGMPHAFMGMHTLFTVDA